jgi:hypothetical protein
MGDLVTLPRRAPPLFIVETSPAGRHDFPEPLTIEVDGHRVLIRGRLYRTCMTQSNAARVAAALQVLVDLGCTLPSTGA